MHDHGPLVPPKEGGVYAQLLSCIESAKAVSDKLLTQIIGEEKSSRIKEAEQKIENNTDGGSSPSGLPSPEKKKPRQD